VAFHLSRRASQRMTAGVYGENWRGDPRPVPHSRNRRSRFVLANLSAKRGRDPCERLVERWIEDTAFQIARAMTCHLEGGAHHRLAPYEGGVQPHLDANQEVVYRTPTRRLVLLGNILISQIQCRPTVQKSVGSRKS